jgi:hypothetical protein
MKQAKPDSCAVPVWLSTVSASQIRTRMNEWSSGRRIRVESRPRKRNYFISPLLERKSLSPTVISHWNADEPRPETAVIWAPRLQHRWGCRRARRRRWPGCPCRTRRLAASPPAAPSAATCRRTPPWRPTGAAEGRPVRARCATRPAYCDAVTWTATTTRTTAWKNWSPPAQARYDVRLSAHYMPGCSRFSETGRREPSVPVAVVRLRRRRCRSCRFGTGTGRPGCSSASRCLRIQLVPSNSSCTRTVSWKTP